MSCLKISNIYAFLEGDLTPEQRGEVEEHLSGCPRCRSAVEERRHLGEAFSSLTPLRVPAGFTARVMAAVAPVGRLLPAWPLILASGSAVAGLLFILFLGSDKDLLSLLNGINDSLWGYAKSAAVFAAKTATLISAMGKALRPIGRALSETFVELASAISPAAQAGLVVVAFAFLAAFFYLIGRKFRPGERI